MAKSIRSKLSYFWNKHKVDIIAYGSFLLMLVGAGIIADKTWGKGVREEKAKMLKDDQEAQEAWNKTKAELEKQQKEYEDWLRTQKEKPENQIPGGGYVREDGLYETDCPWAWCDEVPLSSMGEFGQEMIRRLKEQYPDYEKIGPFDPDRATAYLECYFGACEEEEKEILEKYKEGKAA